MLCHALALCLFMQGYLAKIQRNKRNLRKFACARGLENATEAVEKLCEECDKGK